MALSKGLVRKLADPRSFERGEKYFAAGRVRRVTVDGTTVHATVDGSRPYRVRLTVGPNTARGTCSCPYGQEGVFCKHCVAVSLAWLADGGVLGEPRPGPVSDRRLRSFLLRADPEWLVEQLLVAAKSDPALRARLAAAADDQAAFDDREIRERLERAIEIADFVDYGAAYGYFEYVGEALETIAGLVTGGFPDPAIHLAEYALELLADAAERVDDSDGGLFEATTRAQEIHLAACSAGSPDPVALAERLVARALDSDQEIFLDVLPDYEPVLGAAGLARYRELVEDRWHAIASARPGRHDDRRYVVTHLMERLAESIGGSDGLIAVLARDVTSGYDALRIAERLCADGRDDEALTWLERGLTDFEPDSRLRDLAAEIHLRAGRRDQAGELLLATFADHPTLDSYQALSDAMGRDFRPWRERALTVLRERAPSADPRWPGRSTLVAILLAEGDTDAAWRAASADGCSAALWLRLARARAKTEPAEAIPVLLRAADRAIDLRNRTSYQEAAGLLAEARTLFRRCDRAEEFQDHLAALRQAHRTKWALRQELDHARLP